MGREENITTFYDTMDWCKTEPLLSGAIRDSINGTKLYPADGSIDVPQKRYSKTDISVSRFRSFEAACNLHNEFAEQKIGVHNFASAVHAGGGVRKGCHAQEEDLCHCSTLFPVLDTGYLYKNYYAYNLSLCNYANSDAVIYTPDILIIKTDTHFPKRLDKDKWVKVDVLTCAAPDLRSLTISDDALLKIHMQRARKMLLVAAANKIDILVLGAFGCGAFMNDPEIVAKAYKQVLPEFDGFFSRIEFAIFCSDYDTTNYTVFNSIINEL